MGIQDLGAIGEFISSLVIVVTLLVLIYEVRGAKNATLQANAQERQRRRDDTFRSIAESPDLALIQVSADRHLGSSAVADLDALAVEFGLEPDQCVRLIANFARQFAQLRDAFVSDLAPEEREVVDIGIATLVSQPAFGKWYDIALSAQRGSGLNRFLDHVDEIRASMQAT
jgi:hypothetical protein